MPAAVIVLQLCEMFGSDVAKYYIAGRRMAWSEQKYIRGGYTCATFRERPTDRITIAEVSDAVPHVLLSPLLACDQRVCVLL